MIQASEEFKQRLCSKDIGAQILITMRLSDKTERITDAPYEVIFQGNYYDNEGTLQDVAIPPFDGKIDRNKLTFTLIDHDNMWENRINQYGLNSVVEIVLAIEDVNGQLLDDSILVYKGRISSVSNKTDKRGRTRSRITSVYCTGPFNDLDAATIRRTTHSSQQRIDPTDTFFIDSYNSESPRIIQW